MNCLEACEALSEMLEAIEELERATEEFERTGLQNDHEAAYMACRGVPMLLDEVRDIELRTGQIVPRLETLKMQGHRLAAVCTD